MEYKRSCFYIFRIEILNFQESCLVLKKLKIEHLNIFYSVNINLNAQYKDFLQMFFSKTFRLYFLLDFHLCVPSLLGAGRK